jgi:transcriptional regulator with XRE-family HTH domain
MFKEEGENKMAIEVEELDKIRAVRTRVEQWMVQEFGKINWAELARRMKVRQSTVARLAAGESFPSAPTLYRMAEATGRSLDWLLLGKGSESLQTEQEHDIEISIKEDPSGRPGSGPELAGSLSTLIQAWLILNDDDRRAIVKHATALLQLGNVEGGRQREGTLGQGTKWSHSSS